MVHARRGELSHPPLFLVDEANSGLGVRNRHADQCALPHSTDQCPVPWVCLDAKTAPTVVALQRSSIGDENGMVGGQIDEVATAHVSQKSEDNCTRKEDTHTTCQNASADRQIRNWDRSGRGRTHILELFRMPTTRHVAHKGKRQNWLPNRMQTGAVGLQEWCRLHSRYVALWNLEPVATAGRQLCLMGMRQEINIHGVALLSVSHPRKAGTSTAEYFIHKSTD